MKDEKVFNEKKICDVIYKRLTEKINMKIDWYRYYGKPIDNSFSHKVYL